RRVALPLPAASHPDAAAEPLHGRALRGASTARRVGGLDLRAQGRPLRLLLPAHAARLAGLGAQARPGPLPPGLRAAFARARVQGSAGRGAFGAAPPGSLPVAALR